MERRVLFAIFLSFLVLYAYQALVVKPVPKPNPAASSSSGRAGTPAPIQPPAAPAPTAAPPSAAPAAPGPTAEALVAEKTERDIRVETAHVIAVFSNRGARLKSWRLKRYLDQQKEPQELIEHGMPNEPLPFSLRTADDALNATLNGALYAVSGAPSASTVVSAPVTLRFEYRDSAGVSAVKEFQVLPDSYIIAVRTAVNQGDRTIAPTIEWGPAVADLSEPSRYAQKPEALLFQAGKVQRLSAKDLAKQSTYEGEFDYAGVDDNYFMTTALQTGPSTIAYRMVTVPPPAGTKEAARDLVAYSIQPKRTDATLKFFAGPKDFDVLASIGPDVTRAINFGTFAVIVVPLLRALKWVNTFVGNYGWSIVILTILINAVMFPLQHKSIVSMRKMQEIQPEAKAIQDRYAKLKATDPQKQKMNQELMTLYRERGVNPASGCVPMLLTFPVFLAMWALLSTAIELRGAPFVLWIHDLTARDPYYVWPVLMGATQFWQQKMTPATGVDPAQQRMMMVMPLVMTVMFFWMPAGALIYYTVSSAVRIGQQYLTNYLIGPPNIRSPRPPAERRLKRAGGGRTEAADAKIK